MSRKRKTLNQRFASKGFVPTEITIRVNDTNRRVLTNDYLSAKTRQLQEFGYPTVTVNEVKSQLANIIAGKSLDVIGLFMEDDIVLPQP